MIKPFGCLMGLSNIEPYSAFSQVYSKFWKLLVVSRGDWRKGAPKRIAPKSWNRWDEYPWHHSAYTRTVKRYQQKIPLWYPEPYPLIHWMMVQQFYKDSHVIVIVYEKYSYKGLQEWKSSESPYVNQAIRDWMTQPTSSKNGLGYAHIDGIASHG